MVITSFLRLPEYAKVVQYFLFITRSLPVIGLS